MGALEIMHWTTGYEKRGQITRASTMRWILVPYLTFAESGIFDLAEKGRV
jgi:hypothetical protein